ncbi:MAG TPA: chemotaxis protein CheW [Gemmatimonadaceae bacterium]|nr:chemotaxis protein CheW [Gemmatimonadaceae bacterium]
MSHAPAHQIVTFRLGEDYFAADIFAVERVLRHASPTVVPNLPPWIDGVLEYQHRIIPVVNLRRRFGLPDVAPRPEMRILVLASEGEWIGVVVDAVQEVVSVAAAQLAPPPALFRGLSSEFLRGIVRLDDKLIVFLDVQRLLAADERLTLQQATAAAHG